MRGRRLPPPLPRAFFARPTAEVARALLGRRLVRRHPDGRVAVATLVEVEAYLGPEDAASHARFGPTPRAAIMFGPPGHLYVYLVYGVHHCLNVVAHPPGGVGAVLLRAAASDDLPASALRGPGKLAHALALTRDDDGLDLTRRGATVWLAEGPAPPRVQRSPRVGVGYAGRWAARRLRFLIPGHPAVSGPGPRRARIR